MLIFCNLIKKDFIDTKIRFNLQHLVQVHHVIPLQWKSHANLKDYDVYSGYNLMFLPTKHGKQTLNTHRKIHEGGHPRYNLFIKEQLDIGKDPFQISNEMREKISNNEIIPW